MKNTFLSLGIACLALPPLMAQNCTAPQAYEVLDANHLSIGFRNGGDLFWDGTSNQFFHKLDSASTIFASSLWMGGYDDGGNLLLAAQEFRGTGPNSGDFWAGPLDSFGTVSDTVCGNFDYIWKVERAAIEALRADFSDNQSIDSPIDSSLKSWPGRGNPHFFAEMGFLLPDQDLAPFYDENADGIYNPADGDYPVFEHGVGTAVADQMLWMVFNDNGNIHYESNGGTLLSEVQFTAYSFNCSAEPLLQNTLFTKHKIISRNELLLRDVYFGFWTDFDLGCYSDDYTGISTPLNTVYAYNGDNNDDLVCGASGRGFGANPPVQAITLLNHNIDHNYVYWNVASNFDPSNASGYYRVMSGLYPDSSAWTYNGNVVDYMYDGHPADTNTWSMAHDFSLLNGLDVRNAFSMNIGFWAPGDVYEMDMAFSYHRDISLQTPTEMIDLMLQQVPTIQQIYDDGFQLPCTTFNIVEEVMDGRSGQPAAYPNPAQDRLHIEFQEPIEHEVFGVIYDALGRVAHRQTCAAGNRIITLDNLDLQTGLYFYSLESNGKTLASGTVQISR